MSRYELFGRYLALLADHFFLQSMFIHPTDDYDFIIQLDPMALTRYHHNVAADHNFPSKQGKYANPQRWEANADVLLALTLHGSCFQTCRYVFCFSHHSSR